jgi:hypothetical protein
MALKDFAGFVATIFAASVAAFIALRLGSGQAAIAKSQAAIACDKLKFDLFEMRYDIYSKVKELIEYTQSIHDFEKDRHHARAGALRKARRISLLFRPKDHRIYQSGPRRN